MKNFCQNAVLVCSLEKDDERNFTGMQLRVWKFNNSTTVLVRLLKHSKEAAEKLWDGERTLGEVDNMILDLLKDLKIISFQENWDYSVNESNIFEDQDEYEEKKDCSYFAWSVKTWKLQF